MHFRLKKLEEQVIIITGASSGIGLVTARMAAQRGAAGIVLNARNEESLRAITEELNNSGTTAIYVVGDVGRSDDVRRIADEAIKHFGSFET